jgi:hypothetical protein
MRPLRQALSVAPVAASLMLPKEASQEAKDVRKAWEDRLAALVLSAYRRQEGEFVAAPLSVALAPLRALQAVSFYVSEKTYEANVQKFRKALEDLKASSATRDAVEKFCERVGTKSDVDPPFAQMRALFCCRSDGNNTNSVDNDPPERERACEAAWADSLSPSVLCDPKTDAEILSAGISQWIDLLNELSEMARAPIAAEINFLASLAFYWETEARLQLGRAQIACSQRDRRRQQQSYFGDFVRAVAELLSDKHKPESWEPALAHLFKTNAK